MRKLIRLHTGNPWVIRGIIRHNVAVQQRPINNRLRDLFIILRCTCGVEKFYPSLACSDPRISPEAMKIRPARLPENLNPLCHIQNGAPQHPLVRCCNRRLGLCRADERDLNRSFGEDTPTEKPPTSAFANAVSSTKKPLMKIFLCLHSYRYTA